MKKILIPLFLIFAACEKNDSNNPASTSTNQSQNAPNLSGTWRGQISSPNCISTTGCTVGHMDFSANATFSQNGNTITINHLTPYTPEPFPATLNANQIIIPYFDSPSQAFAIQSGTITINNNSAQVNLTILTIAINNITCCTYSCSGTLTKQ